MSAFRGIVRYEFRMQIRRKALWVALFVPYVVFTLPDLIGGSRARVGDAFALFYYAIPLQIFAPIVAGFFLSDRLYRDHQLFTDDWISVSSASKRAYVWGKYLGVVTATLAVAFLYWTLLIVLEYAFGAVSVATVGYTVLAFFLVVTPSYLFIGAYCIAVPSVMSLRLFQILFSCYWLWVHQQRVPSLAGTPLDPSGLFALQILRSGLGDVSQDGGSLHGPFGWTFAVTPAMALLNVGLLLSLAAAALIILERYLVWKQEQS